MVLRGVTSRPADLDTESPRNGSWIPTGLDRIARSCPRPTVSCTLSQANSQDRCSSGQ